MSYVIDESQYSLYDVKRRTAIFSFFDIKKKHKSLMQKARKLEAKDPLKLKVWAMVGSVREVISRMESELGVESDAPDSIRETQQILLNLEMEIYTNDLCGFDSSEARLQLNNIRSRLKRMEVCNISLQTHMSAQIDGARDEVTENSSFRVGASGQDGHFAAAGEEDHKAVSDENEENEALDEEFSGLETMVPIVIAVDSDSSDDEE